MLCSSPREPGSMPICHTCRKFSHPFSGSFTPLIYKDNARRAVLSMKFHNKESYCHAFAFLIVNSILKENFPTFDFITYVPLSRESLKERGFNQAELVAKECSKLLNIPIIDTLLRIDGTPRQSSLSMNKRRSNAKRAFKGREMALSGTALLIDDIYTTGSTLSYTASLLLKMGCDKVYISAVAISVKE